MQPIFLSGLVLVFSLAVPAGAAIAQTAAIPNRAPLQPNAFNALPLGAVKPRGWIRKQLEIQASGLTGHLDEFWDDVSSRSGWLGGTGESWERGPYYLDGLLPLAYQLNDAKLIAKAKRWVDWTLTHQQDNGQIGPPSNDDWWPRMVMLKVLTQYQEVSADPRVIPLMTRYFHYELAQLPNRPLRDWGKYRWQDNVYSVLWLYNRTGDKSLLSLAALLHQQGYDWQAQFADFRYVNKTDRSILGSGGKGPPPEPAMQTHGVNNAMALKTSPIWYLITKSGSDRAALDQQLSKLDQYHGLPNGMFSGDEHLAGTDPSQGIELCAVVEAMFSLEQDLAILGDSKLGDRLEKISYNALPATLSDDFWSHQYDQQPNQIACTRARRQWSTNGNDSNLFGLEPNFGCCTANLHQGWPKLVSSLWMATNDGGLVAAAYAPSAVDTVVQGSQVKIDETTDYPFGDQIRFNLHLKQSTTFPLLLRAPAWSKSASLTVNGKQVPANPANGFYGLSQAWHDGDVIILQFHRTPITSQWFNHSVAFEYGPLVFALPLEAEWQEVQKHAEKSADWQLTSSRNWNYAVDPCSATAQVADRSALPFDLHHPGISLRVAGRVLPAWQAAENSAGPLPQSPVRTSQPEQPLTLIPYGAAKLRITAFPTLDQTSCSGARPAE